MAKNENKIYDYFKCEDFVFNGKYARYADAMWTKNFIDKDDKLVDLYAVSAIIGLRTERRREDDIDKTDKRTVQLAQIAHEYDRFKTIMQVILLVDDSRGMSPEEKVRIAFDQNPKTELRYQEDMKLFNDYARGGLEYLYNKLVTRSTSPDDEFVDAKIANIVALFENDMKDEFEEVEQHGLEVGKEIGKADGEK